MKCDCGGTERKQKISKEISLAGQRVHVKDVEAYICDKCGEVYLDASTLLRLEKRIRKRERLAA